MKEFDVASKLQLTSGLGSSVGFRGWFVSWIIGWLGSPAWLISVFSVFLIVTWAIISHIYSIRERCAIIQILQRVVFVELTKKKVVLNRAGTLTDLSPVASAHRIHIHVAREWFGVAFSCNTWRVPFTGCVLNSAKLV